MNFLRQSTAVDVAIGPFVDDDGITPATGLSITQAECRLKKNNGAWAQCSDVTTATHEEEGWYEKELDATDTNTCGILVLAVYISGNLPYWKEYAVVEEAVYDMLFAASAVGYIANAPVNVAQWLGSAAATPTVAGVPEVDVTHWLGTAAATPTVAGVPEVDVTHFGGSAGTFASGRPETNVNAIAANAITAAATAADFGTEIGTAVWATAARELTALDEDNTTIDLNGTTIGTVTNVTTVNGLAANVITAAATAADFGTEVGTAVWATATRELTALDEDNTTIDLNAAIAAAAPTAAAIADAVWDEAIAGHLGAGSTGEALDNAGAAGTPPTVGEIADAVWDEVQADHVGAGTFGEVATEVASILVDTAEIGAAGAGLTVLATQASVNTIDDFLDTEVAAILADTNELQTDWANGGRLDNILDARSSQTSVDDLPTNAELATALGTADDAVLAAIAALNNISVANILAATVEGSTTLVQALRLLNSALGGKASGLETTTAVYRDVGDTKDRITATVDADGNRSAVTLDLT